MAENEISTRTEQKLEQMVTAAQQVDRQAIEHYIHDVHIGNVFVSKSTLETALKNKDVNTREAAALLYTTGNLQEDISISVLVEGLRDESISVQSICSIGLTRQGERAVPELESILIDPDSKVRFWSAVALTNIDPLRWDVIETLRSAFNDKSSHKVVYLLAADALKKIMQSTMLQNQDLNKEPVQSSDLKCYRGEGLTEMKVCKLRNGQTLIVREAKKEDATEIINYLSRVGAETDFLTFDEGGFGISVERQEAFIEATAKSNNQIMLCAFVEDKLIGHLGFSGGSRPRIRHTGEFGVTVLKEYWGLGVGTELIRYLLAWANESLIIRKINLRVRSDNQSAINLYKNLGFVEEGMITREFHINGKFYDCVIMGWLVD